MHPSSTPPPCRHPRGCWRSPGTRATPPPRGSRDVDALQLEDDRAGAVVAAGDHEAVVARPAVHDGAALQRRVDVARDAVPRLGAGERRGQVAPEVPDRRRRPRGGTGTPARPQSTGTARSRDRPGTRAAGRGTPSSPEPSPCIRASWGTSFPRPLGTAFTTIIAGSPSAQLAGSQGGGRISSAFHRQRSIIPRRPSGRACGR